MVHIDTAGPFSESLGGSRYVVMFVDSASCFQRPYGTRDKSASVILGVVQRFVADMGVPPAFRTDNGAEYTNSAFVEYCNSLQIRRELTAPYKPQQNGPVESGLSRAIKAGHAARIEVNRLFPDVHLERLKGVRDPDGSIFMNGLCLVGLGMVQPLRDHGEQWYALPVRVILREPPADAGLAVMQAGVPSRPTAGKTGPAGAPVLFLKFRLQPRE